jgi:hypothetical protein
MSYETLARVTAQRDRAWRTLAAIEGGGRWVRRMKPGLRSSWLGPTAWTRRWR